MQLCQEGDIPKARLLLDHGADINAVDEEYRSTPLGFAVRWGRREIAVNAGVDEISQLPGYQDVGEDENCAISREDASLTFKRGGYLTLVTSEYEKKRSRAVIENETHNFALLKPRHARFTLGSDAFGKTPTIGAIAMSKLGIFSNLELLKMWCESTPRTIFPGRKIGLLREGYEASFLVLNGNPLKEFAQVKAIRLRVKQGQVITLEEKKP